MCCLYYIDEAVERDIERLVNDIDKNIKLKTGDIHPTDQAPVICKRNQDLYATSMKWGFMGRDQKPLINARAESALEKRQHKDKRMCVPKFAIARFESGRLVSLRTISVTRKSKVSVTKNN